jgi:pimeloyl-ACP methyl ester carboxylesterase
MPKALIGNLEMYYEIHGEGEPLLLLNGLGSSVRTWLGFDKALSQRFRVITCDNRGVGRTARPDEPYSIPQMAADAAGLLDHLSIRTAHIAGLSMGGYIAQETALRYPLKVGKVILMATHPGGPDYLRATKSIWDDILDVRNLSREEVFRKSAKYCVTPEFFLDRGDLIDRFIGAKLTDLQPAYAFQRQFQAALQHDTRARLHSITSPTLVIGGRKDRIVPPVFTRRLADGIPGAKLVVMKKAAHLVYLEAWVEVLTAVTSFLKEPVVWSGFVKRPREG